jgi:KDO2-lipid IV(A) lauroyltransferase
MKLFGYLVFRLLVLLFALLPLCVAYVISDGFYFLAYYLIGYRKKVVKENLTRSFPQKTPEEITRISKKYYHFLCDLLIEALKGVSMSKKQVLKRHKLLNEELIEPYYKAGRSIVGVSGHYANWEWAALSGGIQVPYPLIAFYKPMSNRYIDVYMKKRRAKFNCTLASIKETYSTFEQNYKRPSVFMMVGDQSPTNLKECFWIDFLNQDTPCLHGIEKYARMYNLPVVYVDIQRVKRGYYEMTFTVLTENPTELPTGGVNQLYFSKLESVIKADPAYWLWSHRRWKHKRTNSTN